MRTRLLLALGALLMPVPAASASHHTYEGGCGFDTVRNDLSADVYTGVIYAAVAFDGPHEATITCYVEVDGAAQPQTTLTTGGVGAAAGIRPISFSAADTAFVTICELVTFADEPSVTYGGCPPHWDPEPLLDRVNRLVFEPYVDPVLCPELAARTGSYAEGTVTVEDDGDVRLGSDVWWECPPYWS